MQVMGWVEAASCRPYNLSAGESALAFVRPDGIKQGSVASQQCARALKLASQYITCSDPLQVHIHSHHCRSSLGPGKSHSLVHSAAVPHSDHHDFDT